MSRKRKPSPRWQMVNSGRWHLRTPDDVLLGFVAKAYPQVWDAYICTGKPWPECDQLVDIRAEKRDFISARQSVERACLGGSKAQ